MYVIAATFTQGVAAVSRCRQRLALLHALAVLHHERAASQVCVMAELAVAVVDSDVVSERMMPVILLQSEIVGVRDPAFIATTQLPARGAISKACRLLPQCENVPYGPCVMIHGTPAAVGSLYPSVEIRNRIGRLKR